MRVQVQTLLVCLLLALGPLAALAAPTSSCHCFQDRLYEPTTPALADPYFLATTQNSLLSVVYRIPKRDIVQRKMGGADADLLWVLYAVADRYSVSPEDVSSSWDQLQNWRQVLIALERSSMASVLDFPVSTDALKSTDSFAAALVHLLLKESFGILPADIDSLIEVGASRKELLITILLAGKLERSMDSIWRAKQSGSSTWGSLLFEAEIAPKDIAVEWGRLLVRNRELKNAGH